jgi:2-polyprenyl-6-methoxyphenol hydroxylase-like FAD-dependent oxidoreductase
MRVAVVGCGTGGPATARFLAGTGAGHRIAIFERFAEPRPVGAGILLQPTGQAVLDRLGLLDRVAATSSVIERVYAVSHRDRVVMDFGYEDIEQGLHAYGVHRGALFHALYDGLGELGVDVRLGIEIAGFDLDGGGSWLTDLDGGRHGPFDLVVAADGARSRMRRAAGPVLHDAEYPWGAIWAVVPDTRDRYSTVLYQHYRSTRVTFGLLPTGTADGRPMVSLYWSIENRRVDEFRRRGLDAFKREIRGLTSEGDEVLDQVHDMDQLTHAVYRDVVLRRLHRAGGLVFVGDAGHATSPQLGQGANLALLDAAALGDAIGSAPTVADALAGYERARRAHIRTYSWFSRLMTPLFQSNLVVLGPPRDLLLEPMSRPPPIRRFMVELLAGRLKLKP